MMWITYHRKEEGVWWWNSHCSEGCGLKQCDQHRQLFAFQMGNRTLLHYLWFVTATNAAFPPLIHYTANPSPRASWRTQSGCKSHEMICLFWITLQPRCWFCPRFDPCMVRLIRVSLPIRDALVPPLERTTEYNVVWCCLCNAAYKKGCK